MVTFVEAGNEEDAPITRAKEKESDAKEVDITVRHPRRKSTEIDSADIIWSAHYWLDI